MSKKIINLGKVKAKTKEMRLNGKVIEHKYDDETEWKELVDLKKVGSSIETVSGYSELPINANENDVAIVEKEEYVRTDSETVIEPVKIKAPVEGNDYNNFVHAVFKDDFGFLLDKEELQASGAKTLEAKFSFYDNADTSIQINELSAEAASIHGGVNHPVGAVVISTDDYNTSYIKIRGLSVKDFTIMMMGLELPDDMFAVFLGDYANDISADNPTYNWAKFIQTTEPVNEHSIDMGGIYGTVIFDIDMDWVLDAPIGSVSLRLTDETYEDTILDEHFGLGVYNKWVEYSTETQSIILANSNLIINHIAYGKETTKSTDIYNPKGLFQNDNGEWGSLEEKMNTPRFVDTYADLPKTSIENGIMAVTTESSITVEPDTTTTSIKVGNTYKLISANNITLDDFNALINDISSEYLPTDNVEAWIPLEIIVSENEYEECWPTVIRQSLGETGTISLFALPAYLKKGENIDGYESKVYRYAAYIMEIPQGLSLGDLGLIPPIIGQDTPPTFIPEAGKWYWFDVVELDNGETYLIDGVFHEGFLEDYPYNIELHGEIRWNKDAETLYYDVSSFDTRVFNFIDLGEIVTNVYPAGFYRYNNGEWNLVKAVSGDEFANKDVIETITAEDIGNIQENTEKRHEHGNKYYLDQINQQSIDRLNQVETNTNARHTHSNKSYIDQINYQSINRLSQVDANTKARHTHNNQSALSQINDTTISNISSNTNARHTHNNQSVLDLITAEHLDKINSNTNNRHTHNNQNILDAFSLINGELYYEDIPVGSGVIKTETISTKNPTITLKTDTYTSISGRHSYINIESIPEGKSWVSFILGTGSPDLASTKFSFPKQISWSNGIEPPPIKSSNHAIYFYFNSIGNTTMGDWYIANISDYKIDNRLIPNGYNPFFAKIEDGRLIFAPLISGNYAFNDEEWYKNESYKRVVGDDVFQVTKNLKPNDECELRFAEVDELIIVYWIVTPKGYRVGEYVNSSYVTNWNYFFAENKYAESVKDFIVFGDNIDTSNGETFDYMFYTCYCLKEIPPLNTRKGKSFKGTFAWCTDITEVPQIDTSNGLYFDYMFQACDELTIIPELDLRKGITFNNMFAAGSKQQIHTISKLIFSVVQTSNMKSMFVCWSLADIIIEGKIKVNSNDLDLSSCPNLTADSIMTFVDAFEDNTGEETQYTVKISSTNLAKLSTEQIAVATNKNILLA